MVVMVLMASSTYASHYSNANIIKLDISGQWKTLKSENGIKPFIKKGLLDGNKVFYVKFKNENSHQVDFSWSLINENGEELNTGRNISILPNASSNDNDLFIVVKPEINFLKTTININLK